MHMHVRYIFCDCVCTICDSMYPLVNSHILPWKITIFHGKIHYFYGHFPLLFVCSPEGNYCVCMPGSNVSMDHLEVDSQRRESIGVKKRRNGEIPRDFPCGSFQGCPRIQHIAGWWVGNVWNIFGWFSPRVGMMIQSDFHIFRGAWKQQLDIDTIN